MTVLNCSDKTQLMIGELINSSFEFFLTGSRFFMSSHEKSDWDFFVQESSTVIAYLDNIGFKLESNTSYQDDPLIIKIFKYDMIHIQVVSNALLKNKVQQCLVKYVPGVFFIEKNTKKLTKIMWELAFDLLNIKRE